jgi:hypothetical protein
MIPKPLDDFGTPIGGYDDDEGPPCPGPRGHEWAYTGTAYGGDDASYHGEGRCYCIYCGTDGDG